MMADSRSDWQWMCDETRDQEERDDWLRERELDAVGRLTPELHGRVERAAASGILPVTERGGDDLRPSVPPPPSEPERKAA